MEAYQRAIFIQRLLAARAHPGTRGPTVRPLAPRRNEPRAPHQITPQMYEELFGRDSVDESDRMDVSTIGGPEPSTFDSSDDSESNNGNSDGDDDNQDDAPGSDHDPIRHTTVSPLEQRLLEQRSLMSSSSDEAEMHEWLRAYFEAAVDVD